MASKDNVKVVVIHGTHHALVEGKRVAHKPGESVEMSKDDLLNLDPQFRNGIGDLFASPEKAAKLKLKRDLEAELDADEADPGDEDEDAADPETDEPDEVPEAAPTPPADGKVKKKSKAKA